MYTLILLRHGESQWNKENRFTGWCDVPLSESGESEAIIAGELMKGTGIKVDIVFTSVLKRAIKTCNIALELMDQSYVPVIKSWRLNERHYGALQGLNKSETAAKHGEEQVKVWRRSYDVPPPPMSKNDINWNGQEIIYKYVPTNILPVSESLKDTIERVLPFWYDQIAPALFQNKVVLVVAHGNSLRGLVKHLNEMTEREVLELNIPTGVPLMFELDKALVPIRSRYLIDEDEVKAKIAAVAAQGRASA